MCELKKLIVKKKVNPLNKWDQADMNLKIFQYLIQHYLDIISEIKSSL
jgi:hypothetical protein